MPSFEMGLKPKHGPRKIFEKYMTSQNFSCGFQDEAFFIKVEEKRQLIVSTRKGVKIHLAA